MSDLIDRRVAIEALKREASCGDRDCEKGLMIAADILELLPSAQPERKKGKWIHYDDGSVSYRCSICGKHQYGNFSEIFFGEFHYCPNCGAKMEDEDADKN